MIAILHNIRSLHNIGSIFRTADAAGIEKIYLTGITSAPIDRFQKPRIQITKVSLGAENYISWEKAKSLPQLIINLKKEGFRIIALEQSKKSVPYYSLSSSSSQKKLALIVGNEVQGLSKSILEKADTIIEIPMQGRKESLNVAVAFGIVAFSLRREL